MRRRSTNARPLRAVMAAFVVVGVAIGASGCAATVSGSAAQVPTASSVLAASSSAGPTPGSGASTLPTDSGTVSGSRSGSGDSPGASTQDSSTSDSGSSGSGSSGSGSSESSAGHSSSRTSTSSTAGSSSSAGASIDPEEFSARLHTANASVRSLVGKLTIDAGTTTATATFSETVAGGLVTGMDMNLLVGVSGTDIALRLLLIKDKVFVGGDKILEQMGVTGKRWALATPTSSNPTLRTLAAQLGTYLQSAGADQYSVQAASASEVLDLGPTQVKGAPAHRYRMTVDIAKAAEAATGTLKKQFQQSLAAGLRTIPVTLVLNSDGRVLRAENRVTASGVSATTVFEVTAYDTRVTISAPNPATVYTG